VHLKPDVLLAYISVIPGVMNRKKETKKNRVKLFSDFSERTVCDLRHRKRKQQTFP
jgi:hypothetical protein